MSVTTLPRDTILASASRTSDAASITTLAGIPLLSLTFTPDDRPFGVRLLLPGVVKDATGAVVTAYVADTTVSIGLGLQAVTAAANATVSFAIDLEPGAIATQGLITVTPGTPLTLKAALQNASGGAVVKGGPGGIHPVFYAYTSRV